LLNYNKRLRKLWQETGDPECKTAFNWVSKAIRRLTRKKILERWETRLENAEETPQAIWSIKSLINRDGPRAPTAIHGTLGLESHPMDKANPIADCLDNHVRFEVFKAVTMKNGVFWGVTPRGSCKNLRFGGT
jgi:hypothetical protein